MVPVNNTPSLLLSDARSALQRALARRPQTDPAILFAHWMLRREEDAAEAKQIATAAAQRTGAQLDFQAVAGMGFARESALLGTEMSATLKQGLERLAGRQPFVDGNPMPFCSDAVGILGVALGTRILGDKALSAKVGEWLTSFLPTIYELDGTDDSQRHLFRAAEYVVSGSIRLPAVSRGRAADVLVTLSARTVLPQSGGTQADQEEEQALKLILSEVAIEPPYERAAIRFAALEHVIRSAPTVVPGRICARDLVRLLERVPAGLRKWTWETKPRTANAPIRHWHIDNEYHVQNLLWAILAPIFPDLDDEQYLVKIGQKSPRADLHIPSMKIIIEAKFLRLGQSINKIIDEISADTGLYTAMGNDCAGIIPIIWDDSARSHEHDYLRQGLKKLPNIIDAIVIPRPGWVADEADSTSTIPLRGDVKHKLQSGCILLFQYGSNMSLERINGPQRLDGQARVISVAKLENWGIRFDLYSGTNDSAATNIEQAADEYVLGVLYEVPEAALNKMDEIEGVRLDGTGNYCRATVCVKPAGDIEETTAITYIGTQAGRERFQRQGTERQQVKKGYFDHLLAAARQFKFPDEYVQALTRKARF